MTEKLIVSSSPHIREDITTTRIMWAVSIALIPASGMGIYFFGWYVLALIAASTATSVITEFMIQKWRKVDVLALDGSAFLTGLLLALVVPPNLPIIYMVIGAFFAIAIGKQVFGGLGKNIWNPALVGRAFMQLSFATEMMPSQWPMARGALTDAISTATPLAFVKEGLAKGIPDIVQQAPGWRDLAWGSIQGCAGETSAIALIVGGLFLIGLKIVDWRVPVCYIGSAVFFCALLPVKMGTEIVFLESDPVFHLFAGGLLLGGFFMATDMVTSPMTNKGKIIFALGGGLLVAIIRIYGGYPEGVCYSILLMNTAVPLIDRFSMPKPFGCKKEEK